MKQKILLVDDDRETIESLTVRLDASDYDVISATDGQAGINLAKQAQPDIILLDLNMPVMDGYTMIKELKRMKETVNIPIMVVTANIAMKQLCELEGIQDYVTKPYEADELLSRIQWNLRPKVESRSEGEGASASESATSSASASGKTILIVEDDAELAQTLSVRLKAAHYTTKISEDGEVAVQMAKEFRPNLIILDVMMPKLDGYSALKQINKVVQPRIPVIVMTAVGAVSEDDFRMEGVSAFLRKPVDGQKLTRQVQEILGDV